MSKEDLIDQIIKNVSVSTIGDDLVKGLLLYYPAKFNVALDARLPDVIKRLGLALNVAPTAALVDFIRAAGMVEPTCLRSLNEHYHLRITHSEEVGYEIRVEYQHLNGSHCLGGLDDRRIERLSMAVSEAIALYEAESLHHAGSADRESRLQNNEQARRRHHG